MRRFFPEKHRLDARLEICYNMACRIDESEGRRRDDTDTIRGHPAFAV